MEKVYSIQARHCATRGSTYKRLNFACKTALYLLYTFIRPGHLEHYYSLTGRMRAIFVGGLVLLGVLVFAGGLLVGHEMGVGETIERSGALNGSQVNSAQVAEPVNLPPPSPTAPPPPAALFAKTLTAEQVPEIQAEPQPPTKPDPPPVRARSPDANTVRAIEPERRPREVLRPAQDAEEAESRRAREAVRPQSPVANRFVVYAGAFEDGAKAENMVAELKQRGLVAETREVARPGKKVLFAVRVGPFDTRARALAALPEIREAGADGSTIHAIP